jgi:hypothetical protein
MIFIIEILSQTKLSVGEDVKTYCNPEVSFQPKVRDPLEVQNNNEKSAKKQ